MEKRISNFGMLCITMVIIGLIVITASIMKIIDLHNERMIYAMKTKVEYYAKRCYLEEKCIGEITLNNLYELDYIDEVVNPVTKEIINSNLQIKYENDTIIINWEEN